MTPAAILEIIRLSLALALEAVQNMTPEQKAAFLDRHERRMAFWDQLLDKVKDHNA